MLTEVSSWVVKTWEKIPVDAIRKAFANSGVCQSGVHPKSHHASEMPDTDVEEVQASTSDNVKSTHPFNLPSDDEDFSRLSSIASSDTD